MNNNKTQNRRKFLKQSMTGMAGAIIIPVSAKSSIQPNVQEKKGKKMVYRILGKTGLKIPVISMGTGDTDNPNLIKAALDEGITYLATTADTKIYDAVITAYNFRKNNYMEIKESIAYAADAGIGIIAMKTMAGSYWDKERKIPINPGAALKWVLQDKNVHTTIPGFTTFDQMHQDIALMADLQLTGEEKKDLKLTSENNPIGLYCQQCGKCINQCSKSLDIPTLMRSYMYAYGYKNLAHAQSSMLNANLSDVPCSDCKTCDVKCVMGFNIKNKILDIARLNNVPKEFFV